MINGELQKNYEDIINNITNKNTSENMRHIISDSDMLSTYANYYVDVGMLYGIIVAHNMINATAPADINKSDVLGFLNDWAESHKELMDELYIEGKLDE